MSHLHEALTLNPEQGGGESVGVEGPWGEVGCGGGLQGL